MECLNFNNKDFVINFYARPKCKSIQFQYVFIYMAEYFMNLGWETNIVFPLDTWLAFEIYLILPINFERQIFRKLIKGILNQYTWRKTSLLKNLRFCDPNLGRKRINFRHKVAYLTSGKCKLKSIYSWTNKDHITENTRCSKFNPLKIKQPMSECEEKCFFKDDVM